MKARFESVERVEGEVDGGSCEGAGQEGCGESGIGLGGHFGCTPCMAGLERGIGIRFPF